MRAGIPDWFAPLLTISPAVRDAGVESSGNSGFVSDDGVLRSEALYSESQDQTSDAFEFKWKKRDTFEGSLQEAVRAWLRRRYGDMAAASWLFDTSDEPILLDAGCGAALSALELFGPVIDRLRYVGADISEAVDVARARFGERGLSGVFLQSNLLDLPIAENSVDLVFSEGVLHHTDDTRSALGAVVRHLKPGGRALFYVYRKKGPIREYTDDFIRQRLQGISFEDGWAALMPLTKLGKALGELDVEVDVPEEIDLLGIPAGRINIQRLFYWHVFKAFYRPELSLEEMNHVNFDWFAPRNAHRHTTEEVRDWCRDLNLEIERERVEQAGITVIARKLA